MYFKEEDKLVNYSITYKDRDEVAKMTLERLYNLKGETSIFKKAPKTRVNVVSDKNGLHLDSFYYDSFAVKRERISSDVPFTIGVGKDSISSEDMQWLHRSKISYLSLALKSDYLERLLNVLHYDTTNDNIFKIIETLENDPIALETFYKEYQSDLVALRELLPLIELVEVSRVSFDEQKNRIDSLIQERKHILAKFDLNSRHPKTSHSGYRYVLEKVNSIDNEIGSLPSQLNLALENTEVAKKLNLQFKKVK